MRRIMVWAGLLLVVAAPAFPVSVQWETSRSAKAKKWDASARIARFQDGPVAALADTTLSRQTRDAITAFVAQARKETVAPGYPMAPWEYIATTFVSIAQPDFVSAYVTSYAYTGGAHGMTTFTGLNVGRVNGKPKVLTLQDLFRADVSGRAVAVEAVKKSLRANPRALWFEPDADPAMRPDDEALVRQFVVTPAGISFLLEPYLAAPYASGTFFVKIPFSEFEGHLDPDGPLKTLLQP